MQENGCLPNREAVKEHMTTWSPVVTVVLYCLLLVQSQIALWDNANTMLSPSDQLTN